MGRFISWLIVIALTIAVIEAIIEAFVKIWPLLLIAVLLSVFAFKASKTRRQDTTAPSPDSCLNLEVISKLEESVIDEQADENPSEPETVCRTFQLQPDVSSWNTEIPSDTLTELLSQRPFYDVHEMRCVTDGRTDLPQRFADLRKFIVLDIETTGLSPTNDKIIEIAAVKFEDFRATEAFETLINPGIPIPNRITMLTGITQKTIEDAPRWNDIALEFIRFIWGYPLVGHNLSRFDIRFLEHAVERNLPNPVVDTLDYSRTVFPDFPSHKLSYLQQALGIKADPTHRALDDVKTTLFLLATCIKQDSSMEQIYSDDTVSNCYIPPVPERVERKYRQKVSPKDIAATAIDIDPNHPLYGKRIVFTGELSVTRAEAMGMAANCGALLRTTVSGKTDFLVVGKQDISLVCARGISSKEATAQLLNDQGKARIQIVDELEFRELIGDVPELDTK